MLHDMGCADVDAVDENGVTALMLASKNGHLDSVQYLYEIKADVNICGKFGTAMHRGLERKRKKKKKKKVTLRQWNVDECLSSDAQMGIVRLQSSIARWRSMKCSSLACYEWKEVYDRCYFEVSMGSHSCCSVRVVMQLEVHAIGCVWQYYVQVTHYRCT